MYAHMLLAVLATSQLPGAYAHPLIEGGRVTFLAEARNGVTPVLLGDFNWWGRYPSAEGIAGGEMELVRGTKWYSATIELTYAARVEYGFAYGNDVVPDPHNPETTRTFGMLRSVVEMPGYEPSRFVTASETPADVQRSTVGGERAVHVYLPPGYPDDAPYKTAYFNDGTFYVENPNTPAIIENLIRASSIEPIVAVFVDPVDRGAEYRGRPDFLQFIHQRLIPHIDEAYETIASSEGRAIIGGSRGALGAATIAWGPDADFAYCGMMAPAIAPTDLLERIFEAPTREIEIYIMGGAYDVRFIGDHYRALDTFRVKGYTVRDRVAPIGHSPTSWQHYIPEMLIGFFPPSVEPESRVERSR